MFGYEGKLTLIIFPKDPEIFNAVWKRFGVTLCTFQTSAWRSWLKLKVKAVPTLKGHEAQLQAVKLFQMSIVLMSRKFSQNEAQRQLTQNIYSCSKETSLHNISGNWLLSELKKKVPTTRPLATQGLDRSWNKIDRPSPAHSVRWLCNIFSHMVLASSHSITSWYFSNFA